MIVEAKVGSVKPVVTDNHAVEEAGMTEKTVAMETLVVMVTTVVYPRANNQCLILPTRTIFIRDWNPSKINYHIHNFSKIVNLMLPLV